MSIEARNHNPREQRALTQSTIEAYRQGGVDDRVVFQMLRKTLATTKGRRSGLEAAYNNAALSSPNLERFATHFSNRAVTYQDEEFSLRAGGSSHWYVDSRYGLSEIRPIEQAARIMIAQANKAGVDYERVAGMGIAGSALMHIIVANSFNRKLKMVQGNDDHSPDQRYGYGLHGGDVDGKVVWVVDDIGSTGNSLLTLIGMVRERGGVVEHASALTDRSGGLVASALEEVGVTFHAAFRFDEDTGTFTPAIAAS